MSAKESVYQDFKFPDDQNEDGDQEAENAAAQQEEGDIELEVIDDTPEKDKGFQPAAYDIKDPTDDEIENYSENVKKRLKELTFARHDERRAKEAAVREREEAARVAQQLLEENKQLRHQYQSGAATYTQLVQSQAEMELQMARQKLREAQESYDTEQIIAAQEALAEAKYKSEYAKTFRPAPLQEQKQDVYIQETPQQPVQVDEKATRWQTRNPWFGAEDEMTSLALAVHKKLVDARIDPRSDEYYERIDARMREVFPDYFGETKKEPKRPASVVAAPTRTAGKKKVSLTKTQEALARRLGLTPQQYATEVLKLNSES
jgi:hypothetical protein